VIPVDQHKEENEKKKEYLRRYHAAELAEREIREEIDQLRMDKMFPGMIQDGMPHGSSCGDLSAYAAQLDELLVELKDQMEKRIRIRREITRKIESMQDETEKTVLRLRYIRWLRWEQIAERMGYSLRNITKIHGKALAHFET
jgi:DNA-directed RNA polymerase specialized sigma subunit